MGYITLLSRAKVFPEGLAWVPCVVGVTRDVLKIVICFLVTQKYHPLVFQEHGLFGSSRVVFKRFSEGASFILYMHIILEIF